MKYGEELKINERHISLLDFLKSYNENMPVNFPRATTALLNKFQQEHAMLFKKGNFWSLDLHRKKLMDWLPRKSDAQ